LVCDIVESLGGHREVLAVGEHPATTLARHNSIQLRAKRSMIVTHKPESRSYQIESEVSRASADESRSMGGGGRRQGC
jgi:hypothetical protein